ncbi:MAG: formylglycine-generating enzyme family protein [Planctomycetota bacterium]
MLGIPVEKSIDLGADVTMALGLVPAGTFMMGGHAQDDEGPLHEIVVTKPFYLGKHEVTQAQYEQVVGANRSYLRGPDRPVERVSWGDATEFRRRLSHRTGENFCLPSEAQWEYACRAGSRGEYCFGGDESRLGEYAWYGDNSGEKTHPVGMKRPNAWRIYDAHGNVWELCADRFDSRYYENSPSENPGGPAAGDCRVARGGSCVAVEGECRSAARLSFDQKDRGGAMGFRVAASIGTSRTFRTPAAPEVERPPIE